MKAVERSRRSKRIGLADTRQFKVIPERLNCNSCAAVLDSWSAIQKLRGAGPIGVKSPYHSKSPARVTSGVPDMACRLELRRFSRVKSAYVKRLLIISAAIILAIAMALHFSSKPSPLHQRAAKVIVLKTQHKLLLLDADNSVIRSYAISIGRGGLEPKQRQGDHKTPEGFYIIDRRKENSRFHRALHVSYPNESDRQQAQKFGVDPGGDIMIHGIQNGVGWVGHFHRVVDWTDGCMAVTDPEIEEIWAAVPDGTPVEIRH